MFGLIVFFAFAGYFAYNVWYMSHEFYPFTFGEGLKMFFFQGAVDFWGWLKLTAWPWIKDKLGKK